MKCSINDHCQTDGHITTPTAIYSTVLFQFISILKLTEKNQNVQYRLFVASDVSTQK